VAVGEEGLCSINISDPRNPEEICFYSTLGWISDVSVADDFAYMADEKEGGLRIADISDPDNSFEVGFLDTPEPVENLELVGTHVYITDDNGFRVIDVSDPENPSQVGFVIRRAMISRLLETTLIYPVICMAVC